MVSGFSHSEDSMAAAPSTPTKTALALVLAHLCITVIAAPPPHRLLRLALASAGSLSAVGSLAHMAGLRELAQSRSMEIDNSATGMCKREGYI